MTSVANNPVVPQTQVAQQVMSLFKGALDVEKELAVFQEEAGRKETDERFEQQSPAVHDGHVTTIVTKTYEQTSVQTHVQSNQKPSKLDSSVWPPAEVQDSNNNTCEEKDIKTSVEQIKTESKAVASFDESLDQFYDVLNDLTA